uniref:Uncharacterized protein n=1 Tax=Equus caballus TaxID=9796 RepID=A0A9L0S485_HORSE
TWDVFLSVCILFNFFQQRLIVFILKIFNDLVKFIPKYFVLFDTIVNGKVFFISFSDVPSLVYRNATDFCTLILYPAAVLKSFITSNSFLVEFFRVSSYRIISSANSDSFTSCFLIWVHFMSLSFLIALATTPGTILNKSGESRHLCLVHDLKGKAFNFSSFYIILPVGLSYMSSIMLWYIASIP